MSRVAKADITLPVHVELKVNEHDVTVKGPKGTLKQHINQMVEVSQHVEGNSTIVKFRPKSAQANAWSQAGTARAVLNNMINGVTTGFSITLELVGVGYRVQASKQALTLSLGFSHPVEFPLPAGVTAEAPNNTTIVLSGIDKQLLGQVAAEIRSIRSPEPYKGKGVRYLGEVIVRKEAKKK